MKKKYSTLKIRKAVINDIEQIQNLIATFAKNNEMLPRSLNDLIEGIREFVVIENEKKEIIACGALHITWLDIAEVRSLATRQDYQHHGLGKKIISYLIKEAKKIGIKKIFALTYKPGFFEKCGFKIINKDALPKKVWTECIKCPKFPNCDEIAVELVLKK
ncbi:MAG TPA: N-acetyltransferase [bacterium]|nr:N-acetyltransferase [bacterium]HPP86799.1 N-acetyltransferase [bacterium]